MKSGRTRHGAWPVFTDGRGNAIRCLKIITPPIGAFTNQGSTSKTFLFFLSRAGFSEIQLSIFDECHLIAKATKCKTPVEPIGISVQSTAKEINKVVFGNSSKEEGDEKTLLFDKTILNLDPWNLSGAINDSLNSIECKQTLEFMTSMEVDSCLADWHRALAVVEKLL